ncbi:MAG TPA: TonB family protein, partial [Polyangiaceae bacterium]|nr:TonB family protein [Polyangiaceae bacterium]
MVTLGAVVARPGTAWSQERTLPGITPPEPTSDTNVAYPEGATGDQTVVLELVVDARGAVTQVSVIQGEAPFSDVAVDAVRTWRFTPARRNGEAV